LSKTSLEPNTFQTPNGLVDFWASRIDPHEFVLLCIIIRKTKGWRKDSDRLAIGQIESLVSIHRATIIRKLKSLEEKGLITIGRSHDGKTSNSYELGPLFYDAMPEKMTPKTTGRRKRRVAENDGSQKTTGRTERPEGVAESDLGSRTERPEGVAESDLGSRTERPTKHNLLNTLQNTTTAAAAVLSEILKPLGLEAGDIDGAIKKYGVEKVARDLERVTVANSVSGFIRTTPKKWFFASLPTKDGFKLPDGVLTFTEIEERQARKLYEAAEAARAQEEQAARAQEEQAARAQVLTQAREAFNAYEKDEQVRFANQIFAETDDFTRAQLKKHGGNPEGSPALKAVFNNGLIDLYERGKLCAYI